MKQERFVARHADEWSAFDEWLTLWAKRPGIALTRFGSFEFARRYRALCQQLALARQRGYSSRVTSRLQDLVQAGHQRLYRAEPYTLGDIGRFLAHGFPQLVRREWRAVGLAAGLLFVPMLTMGVVVHERPQLIHALYQPQQVASYERMYDPQRAKKGLGRSEGTDLKMFGYYVLNNVSIAFRSFASGLLLGVGPVFVLVLNGVMIGAVGGYLIGGGAATPFLSFTAGHGALELLGIAISGGAGLRLGMALIAPGRLRRRDALVEAGRTGGALVAGAFAMLLLAAFIEAYWSSLLMVPPPVKYAVGIAGWLLTLTWLVRAGRR